MNRSILYSTLVFLSLTALLTGACAHPSTPTPPSENKVVVKQAGGAPMLIAECGSRDYISNTADYIVEGTIINVESSWNEERTSIFTYTDLAIEKYIKGTPFSQKELRIVTPGGTVGEISQWVEDQPIFHEGKRVRVYFKEESGEFSIVCAQFGVEEIY